MNKFEYLTNRDMNCYYSEAVRQMAMVGYIPDVVFAPMRGGADFGIKVSNYFDIPFEPFQCQTRDGDTTDWQQLGKLFEKYQGGNILIVDDICDSGTTLKLILKAAEQHDVVPHIAVAIDNTESGVFVNYSGREISRSDDVQWFVFPWEDWWKRSNQ
jgi:hypoxanthine phosphoribosyltransferase